MKKPPQKVAYLSRNSVVSEIFHLLPNECPTAQMAEFMFQNVVYRATVYRTGVCNLTKIISLLCTDGYLSSITMSHIDTHVGLQSKLIKLIRFLVRNTKHYNKRLSTINSERFLRLLSTGKKFWIKT